MKLLTVNRFFNCVAKNLVKQLTNRACEYEQQEDGQVAECDSYMTQRVIEVVTVWNSNNGLFLAMIALNLMTQFLGAGCLRTLFSNRSMVYQVSPANAPPAQMPPSYTDSPR